jgi:predicted AAA+ superfamily ATPase
VQIGKNREAEIDFLAKYPDGKVQYIQVAYTTRNEATLTRELDAFKIRGDYTSRILLTLDPDPPETISGIRKMNIIDWLLGKGGER